VVIQARYVFTALLPLLGTWVGTILAFYFSTENFQAASDSVRKTIKDVQKERLETHLAGETMLSYDKIKGVEVDDLQEGAVLKIKLEEKFQSILSRQYTRIPIFNQNRVVLYMIHGSVLFEFFSEIQSDDPVTIVKKEATLGDLLEYRNEKYKKLITETFVIVGKNQTLAHAKSLMDKISKEIGETCQDVFVTDSGNRNERVLGWLTDKRIERYSYLEG
jgi:hypothetical protein